MVTFDDVQCVSNLTLAVGLHDKPPHLGVRIAYSNHDAYSKLQIYLKTGLKLINVFQFDTYHSNIDHVLGLIHIFSMALWYKTTLWQPFWSYSFPHFHFATFSN